MSNSFESVLEHIRSTAKHEAEKGRLFERLMKTYFERDPVYEERFSRVWMWSEWAPTQPNFDAKDKGIDLVAEERKGGFCAIQCKCHASGRRITKKDFDSFISASNRDTFTARILVDTGSEWGHIAEKEIQHRVPPVFVLGSGDLAKSQTDWPDLTRGQPEDLRRCKSYELRPHQQCAFDDVQAGFTNHDRGKLIMACGTGKTFAALRIAESIAGIGGRVLYLVPSIALLQQSMREWAEQGEIKHRYIGICSDATAGRYEEDASIEELEIPVTTDAYDIQQALCLETPDHMKVVFCTYQSLKLIEEAQDGGAPEFDLVLCDEAHRTTGIDKPDDKTSPFVLVHDSTRIRAAKRLYMTATPRLFKSGMKSRAADHNREIFSMDDPAIYGPEFHYLPFSRAVDQDLLSDYKVVVFAISEEHVSTSLQSHLKDTSDEINLSDAARIVGCWRILQDPEERKDGELPDKPLQRAILFTNTIDSSKRLKKHWAGIVENAASELPDNDPGASFRCETKHVDGKDYALTKKARIQWLKDATPDACRILSNARCLSEGIDVPDLDAVIFMNERKSMVDIIQAVGRVMRKPKNQSEEKSKSKKYGYVVLPIAVPPYADPRDILDTGKTFDVVWSVLRALRSHDDRLDAEINRIDLNIRQPERIIFKRGIGSDSGLSEMTQGQLPLRAWELPADAIYAKIVDTCGDRRYWESWANDVADIFTRLVHRIKELLANPDNIALKEWFDGFLDELRDSINKSITADSAIDMMAQHILTRPVFEAMFEGYDFARGNPVAQVLDSLRDDFGEFGLENETRDLQGFYDSVALRARGLDNAEARQRVLMDLYEKFFVTAMKKDAERLGIVYTPIEIVDFILASADHVMRSEFGRPISDKNVHVIDPFTGTGVFLVRLLQSGLISDEDLVRKYAQEMHANELVLLAYYIAAIHIEEAYRGRLGEGTEYEPFEGIVLTDTFNMHTERSGFPKTWLPVNSERAERQQNLPIQVIVGNPPWSAGQRSSADDNPNVSYPEMEERIARTYAARSTATLKNSLYDTYKMALRWASDRIGDQGVVAFVTNGSWIDGNADSGVRACLAEEFTSVQVVDLRGNQRTQGERSRREGGKVFGQGSRAPVAITVLTKNPNAAHQGCRIRYRDIGDYLSRKQKLDQLGEWGSIAGIRDWQEIHPDDNHDWVRQRDQAFQLLFPLGSKEAKAGKTNDTIFGLYSLGYATSRDAYIYNFSREACAENARRVVDDYSGALAVREEHPEYSVDSVANLHSSNLRWDSTLKDNLRRGKNVTWSLDKIQTTQYRPFVKQHCYVEYTLVNRKHQQDRIFPPPGSPLWYDQEARRTQKNNVAICVPGIGATKPFSILVADHMPDLHFLEFGQCFPRWVYSRPRGFFDDGDLLQPAPERVDNITDVALRLFRTNYGDNTITKDEIFDYVYGILHAPAYRERFANDLAKALPRIPFAADFRAFADAGRKLTDLHLGYESCPEYPLETTAAARDSGPGATTWTPEPHHCRISKKKMRFIDSDKTVLAVNDHLHLTGIPPEAHQYEVNGRTPIEWFMDRYRIKTDKQSRILNDPNGWFEAPRDLVTAFRRIVHVSVTTAAIVDSLPNPFPDEDAESISKDVFVRVATDTSPDAH